MTREKVRETSMLLDGAFCACLLSKNPTGVFQPRAATHTPDFASQTAPGWQQQPARRASSFVASSFLGQGALPFLPAVLRATPS